METGQNTSRLHKIKDVYWFLNHTAFPKMGPADILEVDAAYNLDNGMLTFHAIMSNWKKYKKDAKLRKFHKVYIRLVNKQKGHLSEMWGYVDLFRVKKDVLPNVEIRIQCTNAAMTGE